ncbi:MAG: hypothetical protein HQK82_09990 [Desulfovibrionaceae bacterium]|nr:hypothetical protein [Desulfovibrionaceae bacterium]
MKKAAAFGLAALVLLAALYFGLTGYFEKRFKGQLDARLAELKANNGVDIAYDKLAVDVLARSAVLSSVSVRTGEGVTAVDSVTVYGLADFDNTCNFAAQGIDLSGQKNAPAGTGPFPGPAKADLRLDFAYDPKANLAEVRDFRVFVDNYFELDVKATILDPPSAASGGNMLRFFLELGDARIGQARVSYSDRNFLQYVLAAEALRTGAAEEAVAVFAERLQRTDSEHCVLIDRIDVIKLIYDQ